MREETYWADLHEAQTLSFFSAPVTLQNPQIAPLDLASSMLVYFEGDMVVSVVQVEKRRNIMNSQARYSYRSRSSQHDHT